MRSPSSSLHISNALTYVSLAAGVLFTLAVLTHNTVVAVSLVASAAILGQSWYGPVFAAIQGATPQNRRATAASFHALLVNLLGVSTGPLLYGILSDLLNRGMQLGSLSIGPLGPSEGLRYALACAGVMPLIAMAGFLYAAKSIGRDLRQIEGK